jgi:hypothetical protein
MIGPWQNCRCGTLENPVDAEHLVAMEHPLGGAPCGTNRAIAVVYDAKKSKHQVSDDLELVITVFTVTLRHCEKRRVPTCNLCPYIKLALSIIQSNNAPSC